MDAIIQDKKVYATDKAAKAFLVLALSYLLTGLIFGVLGGFQYILPPFLKLSINGSPGDAASRAARPTLVLRHHLRFSSAAFFRVHCENRSFSAQIRRAT